MGDGFHPLTEPFMRALQVKSFVDGLAQQKEEMAHKRQVWQMEMEDRQRQRQFDDFKTQTALHALGYGQVAGGLPGKFQAGLAGRGTTELGGKQYSEPTEAQRQEAQTKAATTQGRLKGVEQNAMDAETNPLVDVTLPKELGGQTTKVPKKEQGDYLLKIQTALQKRTQMKVGPPIINKETGDATFYGEDEQGNVKVLRTIPGVGGKGGAAGSKATEKDYEAEVDADFHPQRERRISEMMPWAYAQLNIDVSDPALPPKPEEAEKARKLASEHVDEAIKEERRTRLAQTRRAGGSQAPGASAGQSLKGYSIPRANVAAAAKAKGLTPQAFEQQWKAAGGTVNP